VLLAPSGLSGGDLVLARESAEDLFSSDPVLGEVDLRWAHVGLVWCELAKGTVRPGSVVMLQVLGQHLPQVMLIDDQQVVEEFTAQRADAPLADGFARGACGGLARIRMPSAWKTASNESVNWPARSRIRNLTEAARWPMSIRKLRAACVVHGPSGGAVMPAR
jgi:hypothetical protein